MAGQAAILQVGEGSRASKIHKPLSLGKRFVFRALILSQSEQARN
jgi:hypothetical protein